VQTLSPKHTGARANLSSLKGVRALAASSFEIQKKAHVRAQSAPKMLPYREVRMKKFVKKSVGFVFSIPDRRWLRSAKSSGRARLASFFQPHRRCRTLASKRKNPHLVEVGFVFSTSKFNFSLTLALIHPILYL
jgi:hypothetical protein